MENRRERLKELVEQRSVLHGEFTLSSGMKSSYYFDGRRVTHDPEGIALIGEVFHDLVKAHDVEAIGGPSVAANPIITAVQVTSFLRNQPLGGFFVRSQQKTHGTEQQIEGNLPQTPGARVALVDDTMTTGGSLEKAIEAVEAAGCKVGVVVVLVDRQQGGAEKLRAKGYHVHAVFLADGDKIQVA